ncbi:MAG: hypothetical protein EGR80_10740 [Ruminiclostridium sp.]|nr:hypothetical protein [Ruminiclostridium sp.]
MKKKFVRLISAVLSAAMTLTAVPLSAFAEGEAHTHDGESNIITTPLDFREKTADENGNGWSWDHDTKTLTLNGVNIQATTEENMMSVVTVPDGTKIVLNGENTIVQTDTLESDTYVLSAVNNKEVNCDGTMTISGDGVLNAENRSTDSMARSLGGSIILNGGTVNATGTVKTNSLEIHNDGVLNANATTASFEGVAVNVSGGITVDGNGSLTAVGCANESTLNSAILLTSNFGDKISVSENGSITVPEGNAARVGIYYSGNNGDGMDAEISGGKVTAYGAKYGIYKVNLIMSGTGSVYATGGSYAIGQTVPTIDEDEFVVKGSTESKASESAVTGKVKLNGGYYEIGGADAKTVVIKPDTSPRIILGKQTGIFKTEEYEIIEDMDMTDTKLKGTVYFDITLKNMSDEEFADARGYFGGDEPDLSASIIKTDYGWVCMVCDTEFSLTYYTDNTLTIKCGDIVSNTVQVKSNANRFNKVTQGDNTNRTVFYTNTSQEEKDNYKLVSTYTVDSESISYNWYSTNSAYSADELGAAVSGSNGEFKLADNIPAGNYVLYCDITYSDGDSTETVTEKFTFTYKECAHENGYSDGKCTNCGALCDHSNIDINTGKCNECAHQFVATISTDGSAPTGYDTLADCLNSITADTGNYVKIYQDIGDTSATATLDTIDVNHNVMIDLNGHKLNNIKLGVNKDVTLTLTGTAGSYVTQVYVRKGGSFVIDSAANAGFNTIFVEAGARLAVNDGAKVTTASLIVKASVNDDGTTTTSVKLATGMKLGELTYWRQDGSGLLKLGNLLDVTRQTLQYDESGEYIDLYKEFVSQSLPYALTVVEHTDADHKYSTGTGKCEKCGKPCEHGGDINTDTGICSICGAVVSVAIYISADGNLSSYLDTDELHSLLNEYNGSGTIKLFKDYSKPSARYDLYGELTIDVNGRQFNIRSITPCKNGKLTIKNSGNPVMLGCNVYPTNDASYAGGTLIIDGDVVLDTSIYVYDSSTVILKAGTYPAGLYARDSKTLYDMLGEGKAFFKTDGTLFNASVKEISSDVTLIVKDHSHTYVDGKCECGYVCPHSDVDSKTGKCTECEYQYAAVIVKDGAVASVHEENEMGATFEAADSDANTGCTLRVYKNYTGSYTTLSGKFTLWIAEKANVGTLTVSGDITVTGSGKNNSFYGDFKVANGGKLTFDEKCGAMGTVSVGAGTFDCYCSFATTLNINDASSDVILHDGTFKTICYNGGGDRANAEILTLLAENRMFMKYPNAEPIDGSKTLLKDGLATVFVASHEDHSYDSTTGKCTICGKRCGHTDVDSKTGMCKTCQYEFVATLTVGDKVTGFDSLSDCLSKTSEDSENYVKIYKNIDDRTTINVNHTVTVDLNGHKLYYIELKVNNDNGAGNLTLTGSEGSYISQVYVCGGRTFKIDSDANINFETIFVEAGARFEVSYGANVTVNTLVVKESLKLYGRTTTSVRLATGMRIGTLMYELDHNPGSGNLLLYSLLGEGKALQYDNSGEYVDIYEKFTSKIIHDSFTVVDHYEHSYDKATGKCVCGYVCPHSDVDSKTGVCSTCEYQLTAGISGVGTAKYFDNIDNAFSAALSAENNGCTLTLYKDCELSQNIVIGNATLTVDVNGYSLGGEADISVNNGGVLYLKDSRKSTSSGCIDAPFSVNGGTLINGTADGGSSAADVLNLVINSAKCVEIYGGIFENVYIAHASGVALYGGRYNTICGEKSNRTPVNDLLAKGYAFATVQEFTTLPESIVDGSAKTIGGRLTNVMVVAHTHTYDETNTKCACGAVLYAKVTSADGTTNEYFDSIEEGLSYADKAENKGCVFTLVTSGKINSRVTLSNGQFTITTSNYGTIYDYNQTITIDGADVIAEGYMFIRCKVNVKSGSLTLPEGSSAGFDSIAISGGTVTVSEGVNVDNNAGADNLFVSEDATDAKLTIGGGTYSNINLGQFKLKDVIASGVRVISYDNPTDPTAEKTAKALLYSDIAEKNNFDSENQTVSYYLFTKCEHKNEDGSYAFNDSGICKYYNSEFAASVSYTDGGEKTELFSDICDAFDKANEAGTATITLCRDIADSEIAHEINVTGNVTLALNGKTLGATDKANKIYICGSTLTVNGNGKVWSTIEAKPDSKLTITNGEYNDVYALSDSEVVILDGIIDCLSVYGTGKAEVSGGKFKYLFMYNGKAIESVLADGYAYKNADGTWLSIDEREKDSYLGGSIGALSVEEAPIKSASIAWVGEEAPVIYRNGEKYLYVDITYELAVGSRGATYSDFVNGNNRIKDYNLYTKYMVHCYEIGKLAAEDGEVEYYTVLKCNGYEYKSNVLKLTLATCSHPKDSFSYENNGLVICGICDALIEAEVVDADGKSLGYADIESAIKLAQENEGSTVKLMSEGVSSATEFITVTGGRFTVDFNGKKVFYQFAVNGGDVTFTSSVKQDDAETLISGITVNGTDAEVTIDGKIKLGSVTLTSGVLKINSAESYIKELSINGGKTVVNGARIGELKTYGGDTVINYVTADSLSVNINGSGSLSIVTGEFGSTTCTTDSGYTLGMAIASGSVVCANDINGFTIYTYDAIQTMTKTDRIFVEKCVHKDGSGSYVLDGNPCPYCKEEIVATVSYTANGGEETDLFTDIYDAFDKANEIGTATVTLYKDITDSELTSDITVTGDITLISKANNKLNNTVNVADGGKLTLRGNGIVSGVTAEAGSTVTVEENVNISNLNVNGGDVQLSGGIYNNITVNGGKIVDLLASGYAYKFLLTGLWLNIEQREQQVAEYVTVTKAPILSAELTANKTKAYRYGENNVRFSATANMASGFEVNYNNSLTFKLYIGGNLEDEYTERSDNYRNTSVDECEIWDYVGKDGKIKVYTVVKYNGYEVRTNEVEIETVTCKNSAEKVINTGNGKYMCSECGNYVYFEIAKTNGDVEYTYNIKNALERTQQDTNYKGCVIKAVCATNEVFSFADVNGADFTFDLNGCSILISSDMTITDSTVIFKDSQNGGGLSYVGGASGNISIAFKNSNVTVESGVYDLIFNIGEGCTVNLNGGEFHHIEVHDGDKTLYDLLGENKAFTTSDGKLFDASKVSESDNSLTVIDHSKHVFDEYGYCTCGYQCAHDDVDTEAGVCRECNTKIYAAITVKSETETTVKYFAKLTEAFEFAAKNENKGCTLKMLRAFSDRNTDINVDGGVLTVDMNGFGVNIHSFNGSGTKITIRSDSKCTFGVENGFSMDGGTVTFSGEVSVVCQNVKLNATYFSSYVEMLDIDTLILEDGVPLKQLARITNANIANINCSSEIYLYQILASGSRVDSQLYSALKANASSNFDNVRIIRCNHPDGVGRDNRCIYCNSLIAASVSYTENGAEKTEYFVKEDLGKAFAKANSVASATITMLMSSAYDTDYLPVTGDVTLIANGDNAILYNTVKVADGGKLTLRGNANIFAAIAEPGSRLTAEEATRIAYLTVNGGDVKLSGGQYDNITVKDGKITDILGNGYAYKKTEGGAWLTLKEREVSEASGVTVTKAPIVKATLSTEINKLYRNSNANPTLKFNLALAHGSNLNDSYVSKRYGINSYVSGDIIYSSLSALVTDAKLSADEIIDKAGDSDVAEIYFVVITDDGYEIKSNTVSIDLVDCDHSQVVDPTADKETAGNITTPTYCEICESKFNAKITKGDDVKYYNDLDEAAKDAQKSENEGCTLYPLYNKNGYGGQLVITEGNFTLKYAVRTAFSRPIIINGKAKLTVTGRCAVTASENQDAFIVRGGDVTFDGLATGSNVTINGGNVTMAANNINCLTINGGNVSISSGGFAEIVTTVSDKVIADYIDHGFWVQDRGTKEWIDIYSLNKATASSTNVLSVRLCPMQIIKPIDTVYYTNGYYPDGIPSLQINAEPWYSNEVNAKVAYQWIAIDENGNETEIEGATDRKLSLENLTTGRYYCRLTYSNAATAGVSMASDVVTATITECEHSGGEATCTEKAKCEICGAEYGEPLGHEYIETVVAPTYTSKGYTVFECTRCKHKYNGNFVPVKPIPDVEEIAVEKMTYDEVDISWKNISGVDGYYVEGYVGNQWTKFSFSTDGDRGAAKLSGLSAGLKYKVRIAAYAGRFTGKFRYFYVDTVPSPVWNINTVKATDETVRISWNRNTRADGYKVEWYIDNQWSVKTVTGNNNIAAVIDGLCAGTRYKVRVSAYKGDLYSPYTYGYIDTLPSKVTGITQTVTSSSFTLTWDKNESADGYTVQYYADGKWNEKTLVGNDKTTVTIGSLKGYKTYKVRIKAYKGELQSTFDDIYITTAPSKVSGLKVKSAVDSKAVVIWNADANADGYNVGYYIGGKWVEKTITDNKTAMAELDGLTPYSTYKVRVRAYKDNLYGDYSYTTVTAVLSPVTNIKVVSAKSNSITVKWGKNASADGYKVEIYKGGKWVKKTLKGSTNATVTIGGLKAGSVYKVRIASYKGANTSTYTYANVNTAK